jgi:hypothetical protein
MGPTSDSCVRPVKAGVCARLRVALGPRPMRERKRAPPMRSQPRGRSTACSEVSGSSPVSKMFGLDEKIASLASGKPLVALAVALLLGLRHPLDPDHLAAVGAMARTSGERARGALIGFTWGLGHATTIVLLGTPLVLWAAVMPENLQRILEAVIGVVILVLGLRLYLRHSRGDQHAHPHRPAPLVA